MEKESLLVYHVEDDGSRASYEERQGIWAASIEPIPVKSRNMRLGIGLYHHLDWSNRTATPFISASSDRQWIFHQARRRQAEGKTNVWVYRICIPVDHRNPRIHFKSVKRWLEMAELPIPEYADYPCTGSEYLFLHHIPEQFITKKWRY